METNYKVKHRRILMPLKLMLLVVAVVCFGYISYAQQGEAARVSSIQQVEQALENPNTGYLVIESDFVETFNRYIQSNPGALKSIANGGNRAADCEYAITESNVCFIPDTNDGSLAASPPWDYKKNQATARVVQDNCGGCCPTNDQGSWQWIQPGVNPHPLGANLVFFDNVISDTMDFAVDMPGIYTLRYSWGSPWFSYVQTEYRFYDPYEFTMDVEDVCGLTTSVHMEIYSVYANPNDDLYYYLRNTCTGETAPVNGPALTIFNYNLVPPVSEQIEDFDITVPDYGTWEFCVTIKNSFGKDVCDSIQICKLIEFSIEPVADAGEDAEICEDYCYYSLMGSAGSMFFNTCYMASNFSFSWMQVGGPLMPNGEVWQLTFDNIYAETTWVCRDEGCSYGEYEIKFAVVNGLCYDEDFVTLKFYEQPTADPGEDQYHCGIYCFTMEAVPYTYCSDVLLDARDAYWKLIEVPDGVNPEDVTIADMYDPETGVCIDESVECPWGTYALLWTEINGTCADSALVFINLYEQPEADPGDDAWYCLDKEFSMQLYHTFNAHAFTLCNDFSFSFEQGWSKCGGPGYVTWLTPKNQPNASIHVSAYGCYCFSWTVVNGECVDEESVEVCFYEHPWLTIRDDSDSNCLPVPYCYDLSFLGVTPYTYLPPPNENYNVQFWEQVGGTGTAVFGDVTDPNTEMCVDEYGCYQVRFIQYNGDTLCADTVEANLWLFQEPEADAGPDDEICGPCYVLSAAPFSYVQNECHPAQEAYSQWEWFSYIPPDQFCGYGQYGPCIYTSGGSPLQMNVPFTFNDPSPELCVCDDYFGTHYGQYGFIYTEFNGPCEDQDTVWITFKKQPDSLAIYGCAEMNPECEPWMHKIIPFNGSRDNGLCGCLERCTFPDDTVLTVCAGDYAHFCIDWACVGPKIMGYTYEWSFTGPAGSSFEAYPLWYDCSCHEWKGSDCVDIWFGECCDTARLYLTITSPEGCVTTEEWKFFVQHPPDATISGPEIAEVSSIFEYYIPDEENPCYLYTWEVQHCGEIVYGQGTGRIGVHWTDYNANGGWGIVSVGVWDSCTCCCNFDEMMVRVLPQYSLGDATLDGFVMYENAYNTPLNGVKLTLWNSGVPIFETFSGDPIPGDSLPPQLGYYQFAGINGTTEFGLTAEYDAPWGNPPLPGANATDALKIQLKAINHPNAGANWSDVQLEAADVNASTHISATDALWVKQRAISMVTFFPAGDWAFDEMSTTAVPYDVYTLNYGDVNKSNIPGGFKDMPAIAMITDGTINVTEGEVFDLPIRVADAVTIGAITINLGYNASLLEVVEVVGVEGTLSNVYASNIALAWSDVSPMVLNNNDAIFSLRLKALGKISSNDLLFTIELGTEFADQDANVLEDMTLKTFGISTDPAAADYFLSYNRPNPFSNSTMIEYALPESGKVRLSVVDLLGQEIAVLVNQSQSAGSYTVQYSAAGMAPGVYIYKITVEGESRDFVETRRMVISH
jgi:hypothetical protein